MFAALQEPVQKKQLVEYSSLGHTHLQNGLLLPLLLYRLGEDKPSQGRLSHDSRVMPPEQAASD